MGIYEKVKGSGVYWIIYYSNGKRHREKAGTKAAAKSLYNKRKVEAVMEEKQPELRKRKVLLGELIDDALDFAQEHNAHAIQYRYKADAIPSELRDRLATSITPQDLTRWLSRKCKSAATFNRYKSFLSLCFREGIANGKVKTNPARSVRQKRESGGRLRFLSRDEAGRLDEVIAERYPQHINAFRVALHTGMRLSEQYTLTWKQVRFNEQAVVLSKTKNGSGRTIPLNSVAHEAFRAQRLLVGASPMVFPRSAKSFDTRHWFHPALAAAEIEGFVWHGLRHTFCSWCAMAGLSLKTIQELAGHKTIGMSARYSHLSPDHTSSEVQKIATAPKVLKMQRRTA